MQRRNVYATATIIAVVAFMLISSGESYLSFELPVPPVVVPWLLPQQHRSNELPNGKIWKQHPQRRPLRTTVPPKMLRSCRRRRTDDDDLLSDDEILIARQFKLLICSASSCAAQRQALQLEEYATFSAFWERIDDIGLLDQFVMEETSCLGACSKAPCVAVEHADYDGTVALDGMDPLEFADRVFHSVVDVDRVWSIVRNAIRVMAAEQNTDTNDDDVEMGCNAI
jgi:hypothetical protein